MHIPDNYDAYLQHEAGQERQLARMPVCCSCGEKITDEECYEIGGELFCLNCIEENKVRTENYIKGERL